MSHELIFESHYFMILVIFTLWLQGINIQQVNNPKDSRVHVDRLYI
jgi:hypothetical protein